MLDVTAGGEAGEEEDGFVVAEAKRCCVCGATEEAEQVEARMVALRRAIGNLRAHVAVRRKSLHDKRVQRILAGAPQEGLDKGLDYSKMLATGGEEGGAAASGAGEWEEDVLALHRKALKLAEEVLHGCNAGLLRLREAYQLHAIRAQAWKEAAGAALKVLEGYRLLCPQTRPLVAIQAATLAKLQVWVVGGGGVGVGGGSGDERAALQQALSNLAEAHRELCSTHGEAHRVTLGVRAMLREVDLTLRGAGGFM